MNFDSKQDREQLKRQFFESVGDLFPQGAPVHRLIDVSLERGVWGEVEGQMVREGITSTIKSWIRTTKDGQGRRVYHSLPSFDSEGNEIPVYKPVALFDLGDYKIVLAQKEKRIGEDVAVYLDLIEQAEERYGYVHPMPVEVRAYIDLVTEQAVERRKPKRAERTKEKRRRKPQPEAER
jgi:hypothetical protein